jgi:acyl-CoA synthetase (AMP-forming)/AMP-acid ligase II
MKPAALAIVALALVIAVVPQFTHCKAMTAMSKHATGATTMTVTPMRCYWSARAEIGVGVPLALSGVLLFLSRRKESRRFLALLSGTLGAVAMLVPTVLIGVCSSPTARCHTVMRPTLLAAGGLVVALSVAALALNELRPAGAAGGDSAGDVVASRAPVAAS